MKLITMGSDTLTNAIQWDHTFNKWGASWIYVEKRSVSDHASAQNKGLKHYQSIQRVLWIGNLLTSWALKDLMIRWIRSASWTNGECQ
jgi:hypothetical protein